jgi:hypothetical protein
MVSVKRKREKTRSGTHPSSPPGKRKWSGQTPVRPPSGTPLGRVLGAHASYQNECREKWESFISENWSDKDERAYWEAVKKYTFENAETLMKKASSGNGPRISIKILILEDWADGAEEAFWAGAEDAFWVATKRNGYETTQNPIKVPLETGLPFHRCSNIRRSVSQRRLSLG